MSLAYQTEVSKNGSLEAQIDALKQQLESRDQRIRELTAALKELAYWWTKGGDCWCPTVPQTREAHSPGCRLARAALATQEGK